MRFTCEVFGIEALSVDLDRVEFIENGNELLVINDGVAPPRLTQRPLPDGLMFSVSGSVSGDCTENYTLSGQFSDEAYLRWSGTLEVCFAGPLCAFSTCDGCREFAVSGLRLE